MVGGTNPLPQPILKIHSPNPTANIGFFASPDEIWFLRILGLIHSDISGPMPITSMNGSRYILTFIDYFSRYTWVFFLKKKSKVCEKSIELKALIENASGLKIKILRSDNGGEYVSN